jgi:hypothetical protein
MTIWRIRSIVQAYSVLGKEYKIRGVIIQRFPRPLGRSEGFREAE